MTPNTTVKLYADDLKAYCTDKNDKDGINFNETLKNISNWSNTWQLTISNEKSKWLLISNKNYKISQFEPRFELAGKTLPKTVNVLDLGVNFSMKLSFTDHISITIAKAKQRLFLLKKSFLSKNPKILILAFRTYIIPLLEYCSPIWNPQNITDVKRLESVQRMFTKRLIGFEGLNYPDRLEKAEMCTLELRRLHADLCLCYNILHHKIDTPVSKLFEIDKSNSTRGHCWKLKNSVPRLDTRLHFFSFRIINTWNSLSPKTVEATSATMFKSMLKSESFDKFLLIKD